jgi:hypothetical protein
MIVLTLIIFAILILLIILNIRNKETFYYVEDDKLQEHINEIKHIKNRYASGIDRNLYYYPYNDIYNKYKKTMSSYICKKKKEVDGKLNFDKNKLEVLENNYQNLRRQISPEFNPIFSDFVQLNTYNSENNKNIKYLKVKRYNDDNKKTTFQIITSGNGRECLEADKLNSYKSTNCNKDEDNQRFNIDFVYDEESYKEIVKNPRFRYPENAKLLNYPITLLRAKNGNCINLYNDQISIEPCKYKTTQMFKIKPI